MTRDQQLTSFGLFLQSARIEKKISIESLSAETRIRVEVLKRLEAEDHENLPDEVFVRGFIRSYALAIGADVAEALERYHASLGLRRTNTQRSKVPAARPNRFWFGLAAAVGVILLVAGLTLFLYARFNAAPHQASAPEKAQAPEQPSMPAGQPAVDASSVPPKAPVPPPEPPGETAPAAARQQYLLEIRASEETWLKLIVDDQGAQEMTLEANEVRQIQATSLFNLLIGNAGGVELTLNGQPVEVPGKSGQVVNIQLP
ncbi:MAG: DUF4115 domain-containing protein [Desulfobacterales bacterium]|nr:DUF4115 domain-containing protein [Desulfobacterales bacterium]